MVDETDYTNTTTISSTAATSLVTSSYSEDDEWRICNISFPKLEFIYLTQIVLIYIIVISSLINLSFGKDVHSTFWCSLCTGCLGYLLPSPNPGKNTKQPMKNHKEETEETDTDGTALPDTSQ